MIAGAKTRIADTARSHALKSGKVPRRAYQHYFIESEGLHSRIHLNNFWSIFWPQFEGPANAQIAVYGADGGRLGIAERPIPRFGAAFVEVRDLLEEFGTTSDEGTVAVDLQPPAGIESVLGDLPKPMEVEINTPYWMSYYDADENYMYVHSIDKLGGAVFGTTKAMELILSQVRDEGEDWRSWRLLDLDNISELEIVAINHGTRSGQTVAGLYTADTGAPLFEQTVSLAPRQVKRVRVPREAITARDGSALGRIGVSPLLTGNGKPYVLLRYGDGPLSIHHG